MQIIEQVMHGRASRDAFMALVEACRAAPAPDSFERTVYPPLQALVPHQRFICGTAMLHAPAMRQVMSVGFPPGYGGRQLRSDGKFSSPLIRRWVRQQASAPVSFDQHSTQLLRTDADWEWK